MVMDNVEITKKGREIGKAIKAGAAPSIIIDLLNDLKNGVVATEANLRATSIGSIVNQMRKNPNREVAEVAGGIVTKWREAVQRDKLKKEATNGSSKTTPSDSTAPASSPDKNSKATGPPKGVDPSQRTHKTDDIDVKATGSATRDSCVGLLYNGLAYMSEASPHKILSVATEIEAQLHRRLGPEEKPAYKSKVRSLFQNLKSKTNGSLRANVVSGQITPQRFVTMSDEDLKSAELKEEEKKLEDENMRVAQVSREVPSITDTLSCPKCHKREVSFYQAQTRSADEPMTTFCTCQPCGHQWRVSVLRYEHCRSMVADLWIVLVRLVWEQDWEGNFAGLRTDLSERTLHDAACFRFDLGRRGNNRATILGATTAAMLGKAKG